MRAADGTLIEYAPVLHGRGADLDSAYRLVDGETLTPDWHGEPLEPDVLVQSYVRTRVAEGDAAVQPLAAAV